MGKLEDIEKKIGVCQCGCGGPTGMEEHVTEEDERWLVDRIKKLEEAYSRINELQSTKRVCLEHGFEIKNCQYCMGWVEND